MNHIPGTVIPIIELIKATKLTIRVTVGQLLGRNHLAEHWVFALIINGPPIDINMVPMRTI